MKKFNFINILAVIALVFFISCSSDDEKEDLGDTENGDTQSDEDQDTGDTTADTTDTATDTGNTETDTGSDTGADTGTDTGSDTGNTGTDTGTDTGSDTGDTGTDTGTDTGSDTGDTGTGSDGNLNTGDTSGNQAQNGKTGSACSGESCTETYQNNFNPEDPYEQIAVCQTEGFPGGYCMFESDGLDQGACNSVGGVYHNYTGGAWDNGYCFYKCNKPSDCRVGYRCSQKLHACMPNCNAEGYTCYKGICDETDGVCL